MAEENTTPDAADQTGLAPLPENLGSMEVDALLDIYTPLAERRTALLAQPATLARNTELAAVTEQLNAVATTINTVRATSKLDEPVALDPEPETPAEDAPAEDAPAEDETTAADLAVTAAAAAAGSPAAAPRVSAKVRREAAQIIGASDKAAIHLDELGGRMAAAAAFQSGVHIVAAVERYDATAKRLGSNAEENHRILFGEDSRELTMTAAICGPAEPIKDVPDCLIDDEPILGTLNDRPITHGQIQLYAPITLADIGSPLTIPAPDCEDCTPGVTPANIDCGTLAKCDPLPAVKAEPVMACLCLPESFIWSAPHMLASALKALSAAKAKAMEEWRLAKIREASYVRTFSPPYGVSRAFNQAAFQGLANIFTGRFQASSNWVVAMPRGTAYAAMADHANAVGINLDASLEDMFKALGNVEIVEYLDHDPTAPGAAPVQLSGALGNAGSKALEDFHQTPSLYVYDKSKFLTGTIGRSEIGLDHTDAQTLASGCRKVMIREWHLPVTAFGCSPSLVIDFDAVCASGARPDMVAPFCP